MRPDVHLPMALFAAAILACSVPASAQAPYPAKAVRVVIPYPPGGGNDIIGRIVADDLGKRLGQQMLVDNRPGGGTDWSAPKSSRVRRRTAIRCC